MVVRKKKRELKKYTKDDLARLVMKTERALQVVARDHYEAELFLRLSSAENNKLSVELYEKYKSFRYKVATELDDLRDRLTVIEEMLKTKHCGG